MAQDIPAVPKERKSIKQRADEKGLLDEYKALLVTSAALAREMTSQFVDTGFPARPGTGDWKHRMLKNIKDKKSEIRQRIIEIAQEASALAQQHRHFNVGAAAVCLGENGRLSIIFNANTKPRSDSKKYCAEQYLLDDALSQEKRVLVLVIVGESQKDHDSGIRHPTLTPCAECRDRLKSMEKEKNVVDSKTLIITAHSRNTSLSATHTISEIIEMHATAPKSVAEIN